MSVRVGAVASIVCAPLIDSPGQPLLVAHRSALAWQLATVSGRVVLCIVVHGALRLPHTVVVPSLPSGSPSISVGDGALGWDGVELRVARWWAPARPSLPLLKWRVDPGAARDLLTGWRSRLGSGEGLTPYADDVLCGALTTLVAAGHPVADDLGDAVRSADLEATTTATSAALLRHAASGWCIDELAAYLRARARAGDPSEIGRAEAAVSAVGHSSGGGLVEGVCRLIGPARRATQGQAA